MIFTDHRPLIGSFKSLDLQAHDPQALNAINEISQTTSDVRFKAGKSIPIADWLSRLEPIGTPSDNNIAEIVSAGKFKLPYSPFYVPPEQTMAALEEVALHTLNPSDLAKAQADCQEVKAHLEGKIPKNVQVGFVDFGGVNLFCETSEDKNPRPMVPAPLRSLVLNLLHHGDHPGKKETARRTTSDYYWPGMRKDIEEFYKTCHPCQAGKQAQTVKPGIGDFPVPDQRFAFVHLDIVGPLPESEGKKFLLTIVDRCSRWTEAYPLSRDSSDEVCRAFLQWVSRFGLPAAAFSDNGNAFVANLFQDLLKTFNIKVAFSPAYHPATNGMIERKHQDIKMP